MEKNNNQNILIEYKKTKDYRFVFLYFIGILFVVIGHEGSAVFNLFGNWFSPNFFNLALFIFCSGYFYKDKNEQDIKKYIWKKFKKLILITLIWNVFYGLLTQLLRHLGFAFGTAISFETLFLSPIYDGHQFVLNMASWFVIPLFMVEVFNIILRKILNGHQKELLLLIVYFIFGLTGIYISNKGFNTGWWLALTRFLYFLPFYGLGIFYNRKLERHDKLNNVLYFSIIFIIILFMLSYYGVNLQITPSWCKFTDNIILPYIFGVIGIAFWLRISKIVEPLVKDSKLINIVADNTYSIMMHHFLGFLLVGYILGGLSLFGLFNNRFNWVSFKNDIWYSYYPNNVPHWGIVYIATGLFVPIGIQIVINKFITKIRKYKKIKSAN